MQVRLFTAPTLQNVGWRLLFEVLSWRRRNGRRRKSHAKAKMSGISTVSDENHRSNAPNCFLENSRDDDEQTESSTISLSRDNVKQNTAHGERNASRATRRKSIAVARIAAQALPRLITRTMVDLPLVSPSTPIQFRDKSNYPEDHGNPRQRRSSSLACLSSKHRRIHCSTEATS